MVLRDLRAWQLELTRREGRRKAEVGLAETREEYAEKGFTPEKAAQGAAALGATFCMPMDEQPKQAVAATVAACRAVVAARLHAPDRQWLLWR